MVRAEVPASASSGYRRAGGGACALRGEQDIDLGSVGPALLPNGLVFDIGKEGVGYLLDSQALGGIGGQRFAAQVCLPGGRPFAGVAVVPPLIYVPCSNGIVALQLGSGPSFSVLWRGPSMFKPGPPIYAGGAVWTASTRGVLYALDAVTGQVRFAAATQDPATSFPSLAAASGTIYAATGTQIVTYSMSQNAGATFGGRSLRLGAGAPGSAALSWLGGTAQSGYVLLPQPGTSVALPASATSYMTALPGTSQFDCFQLLATSATPAFALSDALCAYPGDQAGAAAAPGFGVELDQTNTAKLTWTAPGGQDGYLLLAENEAGGTPHLRVLSVTANATSTTDDTGGQLTCYMLVTLSDDSATGNTDLYCAAPGFSFMPSSAPAATARVSRLVTAAATAAWASRDTPVANSVAADLQHGKYHQVIKQALQAIRQAHPGRP